ncbi:hypothetical protein J6590_056343 [Homalodisca vitripennis]|nr:hypothetical protein J6590_056343 [Homalodisca vitripennis]
MYRGRALGAPSHPNRQRNNTFCQGCIRFESWKIIGGRRAAGRFSKHLVSCFHDSCVLDHRPHHGLVDLTQLVLVLDRPATCWYLHLCTLFILRVPPSVPSPHCVSMTGTDKPITSSCSILCPLPKFLGRQRTRWKDGWMDERWCVEGMEGGEYNEAEQPEQLLLALLSATLLCQVCGYNSGKGEGVGTVPGTGRDLATSCSTPPPTSPLYCTTEQREEGTFNVNSNRVPFFRSQPSKMVRHYQQYIPIRILQIAFSEGANKKDTPHIGYSLFCSITLKTDRQTDREVYLLLYLHASYYALRPTT